MTPAFPINAMTTNKGMTLRDYFAAKAMQAQIDGNVHEMDYPAYAGLAYKIADAMMKAREA